MAKKRTTRTKTSPTKLTLMRLKDQGYTTQVVEHWNPFAKRRIDLFGCIDVLAMRSSYGLTLGVQATSRENVSSRIAKIRELPNAIEWLKCGNRLEVWGFDKRDNRNRLLRVVMKHEGDAIVEAERIEE